MDSLLYKSKLKNGQLLVSVLNTIPTNSWIVYSTGCLMDSLLYRVSLELFTFTGCLQHRLQLTRQGVSTFFKDRLHYRMSQHFSTINYSTGCLNSQNFSRIDYSLGCCFFISITNLFYFWKLLSFIGKTYAVFKKRHSPVSRINYSLGYNFLLSLPTYIFLSCETYAVFKKNDIHWSNAQCFSSRFSFKQTQIFGHWRNSEVLEFSKTKNIRFAEYRNYHKFW